MSLREQVQQEQSKRIELLFAENNDIDGTPSMLSGSIEGSNGNNGDGTGTATLGGSDRDIAQASDDASIAEENRKQSEKYVDSQRQFSLALLNDAIGLGFHTWWILGFALSFCVFTLILAFVAALLDNEHLTTNVVQIDSLKSISSLVRNLGLDPNDANNYTEAVDILNNITRLEGARRRLGYPLLSFTKQNK